MARLLYFAQIVDAIGIGFEDLSIEDAPLCVAQLLDMLAQRGGVWQRVFSQPQNLRVAVNKSFANLDSAVSQSDEIAFVASEML